MRIVCFGNDCVNKKQCEHYIFNVEPDEFMMSEPAKFQEDFPEHCIGYIIKEDDNHEQA